MATLGQVSRPGRRLDSNKPAAWWRLINKECDMGAVLGDVGKFPRVGAAEGRDFAWGRYAQCPANLYQGICRVC